MQFSCKKRLLLLDQQLHERLKIAGNIFFKKMKASCLSKGGWGVLKGVPFFLDWTNFVEMTIDTQPELFTHALWWSQILYFVLTEFQLYFGVKPKQTYDWWYEVKWKMGLRVWKLSHSFSVCRGKFGLSRNGKFKELSAWKLPQRF